MSIRLRIQRWVGLPSPKELGRSKHDALPSKDFGHYPEGAYTWEDWEEEVKALYPVRYFISVTLGGRISSWAYRLDQHWYRVKCAILPKYRNLCWRDLRNPGPGIDYTYGYIDHDTAILYMAFKELVTFVESKPTWFYDDGKLAKDSATNEMEAVILERQDDAQREILDLYRWWTVGRVEDIATEEALYQDYLASDRDKDAGHAWMEYGNMQADKATDMLVRLCKIRGHLW